MTNEEILNDLRTKFQGNLKVNDWVKTPDGIGVIELIDKKYGKTWYHVRWKDSKKYGTYEAKELIKLSNKEPKYKIGDLVQCDTLGDRICEITSIGYDSKLENYQYTVAVKYLFSEDHIHNFSFKNEK